MGHSGIRGRAYRPVLVLVCFVLYGCEVMYLPGFTGARQVPDARILIELSEPKTLTQLYPDYIEVASQGGFFHTIGLTGSRPLDEILSESFGGSQATLSWTEIPNDPSPLQRHVSFLSKFNTLEEPVRSKRVATSLTYIYNRGKLGSFTKDEWLEFFRFYDEVLPEVFPDADLRISEIRHPAVFTDEDVLRQIQTETDIEIPEMYLSDRAAQTTSE